MLAAARHRMLKAKPYELDPEQGARLKAWLPPGQNSNPEKRGS